jgi:hypothetical protein
LNLIKLFVGEIQLLEVEGVYFESSLDLVIWGLDIPTTTIVQRLELGEHKRLILSFSTSLFFMVLDG